MVKNEITAKNVHTGKLSQRNIHILKTFMYIIYIYIYSYIYIGFSYFKSFYLCNHDLSNFNIYIYIYIYIYIVARATHKFPMHEQLAILSAQYFSYIYIYITADTSLILNFRFLFLWSIKW